MKKTKKTATLLLAVSLLFTGLGGCRRAAAPDSASQTLPGHSPDNSNSVTIAGNAGQYTDLAALIYRETGIQIDVVVPPQTPGSDVDNILIMLQAGDEVGIVYGTTSRLKTYYNAGVLLPIDELAAADGYDIQRMYGDNLPVMDDGKTYGLPAFRDVWLTLYNKEIFDAAGVAYPPLEGFTWEKYVETAKLLTDADNGIWGSFMLDYDCYNYMLATQKGAQPYKSDGTANFDDPRYLEAMTFFYSLGYDEKIQPDATMFASKTYPWQEFASNGNIGMWVIGGWATGMLNNPERYPRDWKAGLAPMPYPEGESPSTLDIIGCYGIPVTCKNPEAAFQVLKCIAENEFMMGNGRVPARVDLTEDEITAFIDNVLVPSYAFDGITAEEFRACWFSPGRTTFPEKIIGPADSHINEIWLEEGQLYGMNQKSAEDAIASIQARANRAIAAEKASGP